jgi:hypothetical protein
MDKHLEEFFKNTPIGINSVLRSSVVLAEKVNSRTDLSGKEKCELVVKSLVDFLGEGNPELVALVERIVPGMLELVVSTARGGFKLDALKPKWLTSCIPTWCMPTMPSCTMPTMPAMPACSVPSFSVCRPVPAKVLTGVPTDPVANVEVEKPNKG